MELISKEEALSKGLKKYYTGVPCKHGHFSERNLPRGNCITCKNLLHETYRKNNPEKVKSSIEASKRSNPEKYNEKRRERRRNNPEGYRIPNLVWKQKNRGVVNAQTSRRRAKKLHATPSWANPNLIKEVYIKCAEMTESTGIHYHVNHIIPLQGRYVCGLHVENNLEIITAEENCKLGNSHESDNWQV